MKNKSLALVGFALLTLAIPAGVQAQTAPDLTTTDLATINRTQTYNLGPTGMRGWIYLTNANNNVADFGTMTAQSPWQILVTAVGTNTPASGIMAINDVILGASAGAGAVPLFTNDSRKSFGWAIGAAEASATGILNIKRWRAGVTTDVSLQMGMSNMVYSATAPFDCPKSALILSNAINKLPTSFDLAQLGNPVLGLAMMASGNTNFDASVQAYARSIAPSNLSLNPNACNAWYWGYMTMFLSEYYLKTGDTNVLSGTTNYTVNLAKAQSKYGTFGHGGAEQHSDGSLHGSISWYGPVNAAGLVANMGIAMGKKVIVASGGAVDSEIDPALDRASKFFGYYVGKGSIPYGEHEPLTGGHVSNGKDCMAAVLFALQGNRPVETEYYTRMSVSGYSGREGGHTGQGFSYLWTVLAANVGGTNAVATYLAQVRWHLDLERRSDGSFVYDGAEQFGGSPNMTDYWSNSSKYGSMDPTSWYVLAYSLPKRQLYLTGKNANPTNWLSSDKVTNAIWAGAFNQICAGFTTNQLASAMGEYDPVVRWWAANTIAANVNTSYSMLTNMASSTNSLVREAACQALGVKQDTRALALLGQRLSDTNIWVRSKASKALQSFGSSALPQLTNMMGAFITNATDPNVIVWEDPIQIANGYLANLLFQTLGSSTINVATNLLYPAVIAGLKQPDGLARSYMGDFIASRLTWTHVQAVAPSLIAAIAERSPADRMFSDGIRLAGLATLGKYLVEEGIPLCLMFKEQTWHGDDWLPFDLLSTTYRGAAKDVLPTLYKWQAHQPEFFADGSIGGCCPGRYPTITNKIAAAIAAISGDSSPPTLNNFKRFTSASASPAVITLPTASIALSSVAAPDIDGGTPVFTWSMVSGAGTVSFTPNGTQASSNTVATFSGIGTYVLRVSASDSSILNSNIWITYNLGYYNFETYTNVVGAVYSNITVTVNVATNRAPVPQNQSLTTPVNTALGITLLATDPNGNVLSYSVVTPPTRGTLTNSAPNLIYTPTNGYTGFDSFTFKANDGQVDSSIGTITIDTGTVGNRRPVATNQSVTTSQNTAKAITLTGSDPDGNPLTYLLLSSPTQGTLSGAVPNVTYLPATNYPSGNLNGADSFTFAVSDTLSLTSGVATVSIIVTPPGPVVGNGGGATNLSVGVAQLRGTLTNAPADVRFYWGTTDGGTNSANWASTILLTNTTTTTFSSNVSNLIYGLTYYYRSYASNQYGTAWAPATATFTTLRPVTPVSLINVNFDSTFAAGLTGPIGGADTTWNQFGKDNALGTVHGSSLLNSTGGATTIGCSYVSTGDLDNWGSAGSLTMLQNAGYNGNNQITGGLSYQFEVNGLVSGRTYDLYIGSWYNNEQGSKGTFVTSNTTTNGLTQSVDNGWTAGGWTKNTSTWVQGTNYVAFRSIVANGSSKIAITMTADPGDGSRNPKLMVCGFQLLDLTSVLPALSLTNSAATNITVSSAVLNATLRSTGTVYQVSAFWNTVDGGTNATLWTNSAFVGAWTNLSTVNLSISAASLAPGKLYYFTFRATNAVETLWATNVLNFTTLLAPPVIIVQPLSVTNDVGTTANFTVTATGGGFSYQWKKGAATLTNGGNVSGSTTATLTLTNVSQSDATNYSVVITNTAGTVTSVPATLTVITSPPAITVQPLSVTNNVGTTATFTVTATGGALSYQWQKGAATLTDAGNVSGSTTATLTLTNVSQSDAANYSVVITNTAGTVTSATAILTVVTPYPLLTWDANGTGAGQTDGAGTWINTTNTWWNGAANVDWVDTNDAVIGNGSAGGTITLGAVIARNLIFTNFTGTYLLTNGSLTVSNAIIANSAAGNITIGTPMAGAVGLTKAGAGTLLLNVANTYSGGTTVSNGALTVGFQTALGSGPVTLAGGATFQQLNFEGNGVGGALPNAFVLSGGMVTMNIPFAFKDVWISNPVSGSGGFFVQGGSRSLTLTASNTFSGGVTVNDGNRVQISSAAALGTGQLKLGNASGGTLKPNLNLTGSPVANSINLASGGTLTVDTGSGSMELSGAITNTGLLTKISGNTLTLSGVNTYSGKTTISAGTLTCTSPTALGSGAVVITNGAILNLNFVGTRQVASLTLGTTNQSNGTYGSSSSPAITQDTHFTGTGTVTIGPLPSLTNSAASGVTNTAATLNATLACNGAGYQVVAYWNTVNAGTNAAQWTNSATVGSWTNVTSTNLSYMATGLATSTTYYFTFRATNAVDSLWATNVQSFTTLTPPVPPALRGSMMTLTGGSPSFSFAPTNGFKYRLTYKNALTNTAWQAVIAPPNFPLPDGWSAISTGVPMSLSDTNTAGQIQRFYRIEAVYP